MTRAARCRPVARRRLAAWPALAAWPLAAAGLLLAAATPAGGQGIALQRAIPAARLDRPLHVVQAPWDPAELLVVEQPGRILRFRRDGADVAGVVLDIRARVSTEGYEEGLLSAAFHPRFAENGALYVYYSAAWPRRSVVARYQLTRGARVAEPGSERVILEVPQPYRNHNGGLVAFGPEGYLYIGLGDGGSAGDPHGHGQNRKTLLGSILRIDVDRAEAGRRYAIPADNPFAASRDGSRGEIWAYGLRNPWRFSFDRATGDLWVGDVGQDEIEEVDRIVRGGNYGWAIMEGSRCFRPARNCPRGGLALPITEYTHGEGSSITGGYVYRGAAIPGLRGRYVFGDFGNGTLWSIPAQAQGAAPPEPLLKTQLALASFGEDGAGELYLADLRGAVYRIVPAPAP
ncbi:MAG: PQQ-dependent sugar dehydrogenase [Candidatus Lambdaproteobacteria bacterium]|nr:PQQ-dependent sugar dehydrogenase [Candidatus Lambdaproteobacteria bacterium]